MSQAVILVATSLLSISCSARPAALAGSSWSSGKSSGTSTSTSTGTLTGGCGADMVAVSGGSFALAANKKQVTIAEHCLDRTEVTVAAYATCVTGGKCTEPDGHDDDKHKACNWKRDQAGDHPINCVDFAQATAFCASLGKRLPTEGEWEWSARGGPAGTTFPWGNEPPTGRACWDDDALEDSPTTTCAVGQFKNGATKSGIVDLTGNVWEWTSTPWKEGSPDMVDRGGGWLNAATNMLTAGYRNHVPKALRYSSLGFRCAK